MPRDTGRIPRPTDPPPSDEQLRDWLLFDGDCEATDGCVVEPDGRCAHGHLAWPRFLRLI